MSDDNIICWMNSNNAIELLTLISPCHLHNYKLVVEDETILLVRK